MQLLTAKSYRDLMGGGSVTNCNNSSNSDQDKYLMSCLDRCDNINSGNSERSWSNSCGCQNIWWERVEYVAPEVLPLKQQQGGSQGRVMYIALGLCCLRHEQQREEVIFQLNLKDNILEQGNKIQVMECGNLLERCLKINPDDRPDMIEVAKALRLIKSIK
ncbi:hypothetical protein FEM48_Zijuj01G0318100 [Ziziphus jujuba var. spinosa]|uniref:Protein kinase domain-containing protein n=1 Tax=Ziziphus jujuba var. spinosa TaxID=714518 RepID=A0A978W6D1_ZIZJJ|nr:hypothetical protein FEM48_Zijuj01G0315300 [Ziziphus jujuba var. spinosa]KAH7547515.1 hypothetical protein FEM48_Zijuj01G0318100 [Ziziphus jujuba var. spinosa]